MQRICATCDTKPPKNPRPRFCVVVLVCLSLWRPFCRLIVRRHQLEYVFLSIWICPRINLHYSVNIFAYRSQQVIGPCMLTSVPRRILIPQPAWRKWSCPRHTFAYGSVSNHDRNGVRNSGERPCMLSLPWCACLGTIVHQKTHPYPMLLHLCGRTNFHSKVTCRVKPHGISRGDRLHGTFISNIFCWGRQ